MLRNVDLYVRNDGEAELKISEPPPQVNFRGGETVDQGDLKFRTKGDSSNQPASESGAMGQEETPIESLQRQSFALAEAMDKPLQQGRWQQEGHEHQTGLMRIGLGICFSHAKADLHFSDRLTLSPLIMSQDLSSASPAKAELSTSATEPAQTRGFDGRPSPELIIVAGCVIAVLSFGPRSALGVFQLPILTDFGWGSDVFSFAMAIQYLLWGLGQPFAGAVADRFGSRPVLITGVLLYAAGLALMTYSTTPLMLDLTAGVLMGFGLSGCSFNLVIGAFSKLLPEERRSTAFGFGTAAGSFGQFLFSPFAGVLVHNIGWQNTALVFAALLLIMIPLTKVIASPPMNRTLGAGGVPQQSFRQALSEAFGHRSYVLLVLGFFTCGFQLAFVTIHFQKYVVESGLDASVGYWAFAMVGMFNMLGSFASGWLGGRLPRRYLLSFIYLARAVVTLAFIALPPSPAAAYAFGALSGLLWLSTVPPTSSLIGVMFGTRYFATLFGFAFFSHQLGGFSGLMLSGFVRESTGSYLIMWWASIGFGVVSALVNLPIVEKPVTRPLPAAA